MRRKGEGQRLIHRKTVNKNRRKVREPKGGKGEKGETDQKEELSYFISISWTFLLPLALPGLLPGL